MLSANTALLALIALTPALLLLNGVLTMGLVALFAAFLLGMIAVSIRPGEAGHLAKTTRWAAALAVLPLVWIVLQLLPLPLGAVSRSIWQSAASALGTSLWSRGTIDPGFTMLALWQYVAMVAVAFVAAAVSVDRQQAERVFQALACAAAVIALMLLVHQVGGFTFLGRNGGGHGRAAAAAGAAYGTILFVGLIIMTVERHFTRRDQQDIRKDFYAPLGGAAGGLVVCSLAVLFAAPLQTAFAAGCGLAAVVIVYFVRRLGLGRNAALAMTAVAVVGAALIVSAKSTPVPGDWSLRYASFASADLVAVANRIVGEVGFGGSGAGTFSAIHRLYAAEAVSQPFALAPTFAAQLAVELGRPMLWLLVAGAVVLIALCAAGGFNRGRDFFYSVTGAGLGVTTLILVFCDVSLGSLATGILLAAATGLALAQSISRTV